MDVDFLKFDNDGNDYYILEKRTDIYRADDNNIDISNYKPRFFVLHKEYTTVYGKIIYEFQVKEDLKLLAIDKNITSFYNNAPENIKAILRENYGYDSDSKNRLSESKQDNALLDYICSSTEYNGYAADKMNTQFSHFDPEIAICDPNINLTQAKDISGLSKEKKQDIHIEANLIRIEKERKEGRKKRRPPTKAISNNKFSSNLFGDSDDEDDNIKMPTKKLFGGKRKSKKSNKMGRRTRSKRQRGIVGGIKNKTIKPTRKRRLRESKRKTYRHTEEEETEEEETEEEQNHKREMKQQLNYEITSRPQEVPSLFDLAADSLPPDVASEYNAESGKFSHVDLNPRRRNRFGGKRKTRKSKK